MSIFKSSLKSIFSVIYKLRARRKLRKLDSVNVSAVQKIVGAVGAVLNNDLSSDEQKWVDKIESVRRVLANDSTELSFTDYGAGSGGLNRTEDEMSEGVVISKTVSSVCKASKPAFFARILFKIVREFKPVTLVELGTCVGISAAYQAAALKLNGEGNIATIEGAQSLASLSRKNLEGLGLDNVTVICGKFQDKLEGLFKSSRSIDYVFIDGHHDEEATMTYFRSFLPYLSQRAIIIFDDISWSRGMRRAWNRVIENKNIKVAVDLRSIGICLIDREIPTNYVFRVPLI